MRRQASMWAAPVGHENYDIPGAQAAMLAEGDGAGGATEGEAPADPAGF